MENRDLQGYSEIIRLKQFSKWCTVAIGPCIYITGFINYYIGIHLLVKMFVKSLLQSLKYSISKFLKYDLNPSSYKL